jgi:predicted dehydrogenase
MWQSSKVRKLSSENALKSPKEWRSDTTLTGSYGVSLGLGTHWLDIAMYLAGEELKLFGS